MLYTTLTVKDEEYKLRLNARSCVELEKKLGTNPVNIISEVAEKGEMPTISVLVDILHAALQANHHGMTLDKTYQLYDSYIDEGHTVIDLLPVLVDVFKISGFFAEAGEDAKN